MPRFGFIFLIAVVMACVMGVNCQDRERECGPNETWNSCGSGCGEATCQNPRPTKGVYCPAVCVSDCFCNRGWIRSRTGGPCVRRC
ncbi:chymotrypsin-elastase inhibitor ixodidin-like [Diachasmimorpha longicaudata]|uniref:chymotrypsin-elastase inhibitor ixodidin-like n=1 Tax=Diachasmimorpha longicaudata TaxID=58733 RepID=UPI0030B87694